MGEGWDEGASNDKRIGQDNRMDKMFLRFDGSINPVHRVHPVKIPDMADELSMVSPDIPDIPVYQRFSFLRFSFGLFLT